jgi:hypothetical protein
MSPVHDRLRCDVFINLGVVPKVHTPHLIEPRAFALEPRKKSTVRFVAKSQGGNSLGLDGVASRAVPAKK